MPKEMIYSEGHSPDDNSHLRVGWTKGLEVQVATVNPDVPSQFEGQPTDSNGWFITLDRRGVNEAIKALRTARDQAFGRDE